jgi:nucleotide-binding universal stress UspA family protein
MWAPNLGDLKSSARGWLDQQAAAVPEAEGVLLVGHPAGAACEWARDNAVDLLVAAAHHGFAERIAIGSFAHYLVEHAPCPVLVLRPSPDG